MIDTGIAKLRYLLATRGQTVLRVGVLLVLLGVLGSAVTLASPPMATVTDTSSQSVVETRSSSSATVDGDHELYHHGEVLTDEAVYLRSVTPNATVTATAQAPAGAVVEQRLVLVYEASSPTVGVFREQRRPLATTAGTVAESGRVETSATLRVADIAGSLGAMRKEVGDAGTVIVYLAVETRYEDAGSTGTLSDRDQFVVTDDSFRVPTLTASARYGPTVTSERPIASQVFQPDVPSVGVVVVPHVTGAFLFLVLLGLAAVGAVIRGRGSIDPDRERARVHRRRYDEWISAGELPVALSARSNVVTVESLEALVDVAIDSQARVIYDDSRDCYAVFTAGTAYVFTSADSP